jgi:cellulose synthase/poly-beta-1,6-N-acetylglucosamine synthase-like glycosyltransferase
MQTSTSSISAIRFGALSLGLLFLLLGLAGFLPAFVTHPEINATDVPGFGYLFGVFPTNYFHNAIGILVGLWGIAAFTSLTGSIVFNRIFAILYALGAILGLLPFANTLFGLTPLFGNNVWLNALVAAIAFYLGFVKSAEVERIAPSAAQPGV